MTTTEFIALCENTAIDQSQPELKESSLLLALWHDHRGHWDTAHTITQSVAGAAGSAVHAYLHRKEGDLSNAQYWYSRSGRTMPDGSLDAEWRDLAEEFCSNA